MEDAKRFWYRGRGGDARGSVCALKTPHLSAMDSSFRRECEKVFHHDRRGEHHPCHKLDANDGKERSLINIVPACQTSRYIRPGHPVYVFTGLSETHNWRMRRTMEPRRREEAYLEVCKAGASCQTLKACSLQRKDSNTDLDLKFLKVVP